jgi:Ricin-type beta-trefoil lectin domain-like/Secretion system C-terminal sorting domain
MTYLLRSRFIQSIFLAFLALMSQRAWTQNSPQEGLYLLQNVSTGLYMSVEEDDQENLKNIIQNPKSGDLYQRFYLEKVTNGFRLKPETSAAIDKFVAVQGGTNPARNSAGTQLTIEDDNLALQTWTVDNIGTGSTDAFCIKSTESSSKKLIGVNSSTDDKVVQMSGAVTDKKVQWRFIPILSVGQYFLQNISTNLYMSIGGKSRENGAKVEQTVLTEDPYQLFEVIDMGEEGGYAISPVNTRGKKWLSVNQGATSNPAGTQLVIGQAPSYGYPADHQTWDIAPLSGNPKDNGIFLIRSMYLSNKNWIGVNSATDSKVVQLASNTAATDTRTRWRFVPIEDPITYMRPGRYAIQNVGSGLIMDVAGAKTANNTKVIQYSELGNRNQQFQVEDDGEYFRISPSHTYRSKWLSTEAKSATTNKEETPLFIYERQTTGTQSWDIAYVGVNKDDDEKMFVIKSTLSSKQLGVISDTDAQIVQLTPDNKDPYQQWEFIEVEPEDGSLAEGRYIIQSLQTGKVMDVSGAKQADGASVIQYNLSGADNQFFDLTETGKNTYKMSPAHTNGQKFLTVYDGTDPNRNSNGKTLIQASSNPNLQNWEITQANNPTEEYAYTIRSTDVSSNKLLGVYNTTDSRIVQWSADEEDTRFQWYFTFVDYFDNQGNSVVAERSARIAATNKSVEPRQLSAERPLLLFPNPAVADFEIQVSSLPNTDDVRLSIYNLSGLSVYSNNIGQQRKIQLNAKTLHMSQGVYIVEAATATAKYNVKLIVVE